MWFSPRNAMTKQRLFNFFVGPRGDGKTTGTRNYAIEQFRKFTARGEPYEVGYIRRYKTERKESAPKLFADVAKFEFDDLEFKTNGFDTKINGKQFCHCFALSTDFRTKGAGWENIRLLIFDEFLIDPNKSRYLTDEVNSFLALYDTVARPTDPARVPVPVIFLANSFSINNPYFTFFHIRFPQNKNVFMSKEIYAEIIRDEEFTEHAKQTRFASLIAGSTYEEHSIDNEFFLDGNEFIYPKFDKGNLIYNIIFNGKTYGAWVNFKEGTLYISRQYNPDCQYNYAFSRSDLSPNYLTAKRFKDCFHGKLTRDCFNSGAVYYDSIQTKFDFYEIARLANL